MLVSSVEEGIGEVVTNPYKKDGKVLVGKTTKISSLKEAILDSVNLIGGFNKVVEKGDEILLKPNFNTSDPPPSSSDPDFVKATIELLYEHGAKKVVLGESAMLRLSTRNVLKKAGMLKKAEESGAEIAIFDEGKWKRVETGGTYLKNVSLPETALNSKKVVYICCMKTHRFAKFTFSLKLAVGFMKPRERMRLHLRHLEEKIVDLNLVVHPHLIIMDGRKCFVSGGPASGELRTPGVVLASGARIAMDIEALRTVAAFDGSSLKNDPLSYTQIRRAVQLGLGERNEQDYEVVTS
ncbi:MAG: DUF362 domain-containing protein [Candidatus Bathyarchaeota archaeon]|nr:MAG: DUF362 domain-containing protein [Candidatus Bathyarchaeota archaeon]